jgi:hypothetical protein
MQGLHESDCVGENAEWKTYPVIADAGWTVAAALGRLPEGGRVSEKEGVTDGEEVSEQEYEHINSSLNRMIGQLTLPMMKFRDRDITEVHGLLLKLANWLDDLINDELSK